MGRKDRIWHKLQTARIFGQAFADHVEEVLSDESKNIDFRFCQWCGQPFPISRGFHFTYHGSCNVEQTGDYCSESCLEKADMQGHWLQYSWHKKTGHIPNYTGGDWWKRKMPEDQREFTTYSSVNGRETEITFAADDKGQLFNVRLYDTETGDQVFEYNQEEIHNVCREYLQDEARRYDQAVIEIEKDL